MVGFLQIMIYMLAAYLVFKGVEIFQTALVASPSASRKAGIVIGILAIIAAIGIGVGSIALSELQAGSMQQTMPKF